MSALPQGKSLTGKRLTGLMQSSWPGAAVESPCRETSHTLLPDRDAKAPLPQEGWAAGGGREGDHCHNQPVSFLPPINCPPHPPHVYGAATVSNQQHAITQMTVRPLGSGFSSRIFNPEIATSYTSILPEVHSQKKTYFSFFNSSLTVRLWTGLLLYNCYYLNFFGGRVTLSMTLSFRRRNMCLSASDHSKWVL